MARILIYMPDFGQNYDKQMTYLRNRGFEVEWMSKHAQTQVPQVLISDAKGYDCVVAASEIWNKEVIDGLSDSLRLIARHGVGVDNIDIPYATSKGIAVTYAPGQLTRSVAENALSLMMCCFHRTARFDREIHNGIYHSVVTRCLSGKTIGLIGFGSIARDLVKLLQPFGCQILAYDVKMFPEVAEQLNTRFVDMACLLAESDVVSLHIPLTDQTRHMVDLSFLRQMKHDACLINTSRGDLVVEDDLKYALDHAVIAAAGLDVFATEHSGRASVLFGCENAVLTPHSSANTLESLDNLMWSCAYSIETFFAGKIPDTILNSEFAQNKRI